MAFREFASGLAFPEGPVAMDDGSVLVGEIPLGRVTRVRKDGSLQTIAECGGGANGLAIGPDGAVYVCNNGGGMKLRPEDRPSYTGGRIERVDIRTGKVERLYDSCDGVRLHAPNDLMFDGLGGFYFSDIGHDGRGPGDDGDLRYAGGIYYAKADGSHIGRVTRLYMPNGVGVSPDGKTLYWADTPSCRLWAADILSPGVIQKATRWQRARYVGTYRGQEFAMFDSLGIEANGGVAVATLMMGGITIFGPGDAYEFFPIGQDDTVTNICWGGKDMKTAYVTLSDTGKLAAIDWPRAGFRLHHN